MSAGIDALTILSAWGLPRVTKVAPMERGTNNYTWRVDTVAGEFVLRVYGNSSNRAHIAYEHALLQALGRCGLSFAVPTSVPGSRFQVPSRELSSADAVLVPLGRSDTLASLFRLIPGRHPETGNVVEAGLAGAALGELAEAMRTVVLPTGLAEHARYCEIRRVHALVPDPLAAIGELALDEGARRGFQAMLAQVEAEAAAVCGALPQQIIHSDFGRSSVLMQDGRITGILDFEFASPDARVMDFAVGLYQFAVSSCGVRIALDCAAAFACGYASQVTLTDVEIAAIPLLWRLRAVVSVVHRLGRWRTGVATEREVTERVEAALLLDRWLSCHEDALVDVVNGTES